MPKIKAFLLGMKEFRLNWTTSFDDDELMNKYDEGREFAHIITFRFFEAK
jgi:hypothetical protein